MLDGETEGRTNRTAIAEDAVVDEAVVDARRVVTVAAARTEPPPSTSYVCICAIFYSIIGRFALTIIVTGK